MSNQLTTIKQYEVVETVVPATQQVGQLNLPPNISNLTNDPTRKVFIYDIECFPDYAQTNSIRSTATPVMPVTEIPKISLTLYYDNQTKIRYIPLAKLIYTVPPINVNSPYQRERVCFDMLYPVAIEQCFFQFNTAPAGMPYSIVLGFTYQWAPVVTNNQQ
jgi:hypothetical protein